MRWIVAGLALALILLSTSVGISHPAFEPLDDVEVDVVTPSDLQQALAPCSESERMLAQDQGKLEQGGKSLNSTTGDCGGAPGSC